MTARRALGRRDFLEALAPGRGCGSPSPAPAGSPPRRRRSPIAGFSPSAWLHVGPDGAVTVYLAKSEMGQGTYTAMAVLVAEELEADWRRVRVVQADADPRFGNMLTGGSRSVRGEFIPLRKAGAAAREVLVAAAARRLGVKPASCRAEQGAVVHAASGRRLEYGALAADAAKLPVPADPTAQGPEALQAHRPARAAARHAGQDARPGGLRDRRARARDAPRRGGAAAGVRREGEGVRRGGGGEGPRRPQGRGGAERRRGGRRHHVGAIRGREALRGHLRRRPERGRSTARRSPRAARGRAASTASRLRREGGDIEAALAGGRTRASRPSTRCRSSPTRRWSR